MPYPKGASRRLYHALGWDDVARTCEKVYRGKMPALNFLRLRETVQKFAELSDRSLKTEIQWYIYGVEDIYLEVLHNEVDATKAVSPPLYLDYINLEPIRLATMDNCDLCHKSMTECFYIHGGILEDHIVCSQDCALRLRNRLISEDPWLRRYSEGLLAIPQIDYTKPVDQITAMLGSITENQYEYKPKPRFVKEPKPA